MNPVDYGIDPHFAPTAISWINLVGCWLTALTEWQPLRGTYLSACELEDRVGCYHAARNDDPTPFIRPKTADDIFTPVARSWRESRGQDASTSKMFKKPKEFSLRLLFSKKYLVGGRLDLNPRPLAPESYSSFSNYRLIFTIGLIWQLVM